MGLASALITLSAANSCHQRSDSLWRPRAIALVYVLSFAQHWKVFSSVISECQQNAMLQCINWYFIAFMKHNGPIALKLELVSI
jgi:hypothetical protein